MKKINTTTIEQPAHDIAVWLNHQRNHHKSVLLLLSGGSNIELAVRLSQLLQPADTALHVGLIDERYGDEGHPDSNWQQLLAAGLNTTTLTLHPILHGSTPATMASEQYDQLLTNLFEMVDISVGLFGVGTDGHTAGLLPHCSILSSHQLVDNYQAADFERISLTPHGIRKLNKAIVYATGELKWPQLQKLNTDTPPDNTPAVLLGEISELTVYTDYEGDLL